jgi:hypothetical protein
VHNSFNQSAGLFGAYNGFYGELVFDGETSRQQVSFFDHPFGNLTYTIANHYGINITGTGSLTTNLDIVKTLQVMRAPYTSPLTTSLKLRYLSSNAGLAVWIHGARPSYTGSLSYTIDTLLCPSVDGPKYLSVSSAKGTTISLPGSRNFESGLTVGGNVGGGDLYIGPYDVTVGTSASNPGVLSANTACYITMTTGSLTKWVPATGLSTVQIADIFTNTSYFPVGNEGSSRAVNFFFSSTTALNSGGTITLKYTNANGHTGGLSVADGAYTINNRTNASWAISTGNGLALRTGQSMGMTVDCESLLFPDTIGSLRVMKVTSVVGNHVTGTGQRPNYKAIRNGLSISDVNNTFYIGSSAANVSGAFISVKSGRWNDPLTWDRVAVPGITDTAVISFSDSVTVDTNCFASVLYIDPYGTLNAKSSSLTLASKMDGYGGNVYMHGGNITLGPNGGGKAPFIMNCGEFYIDTGTLKINGRFYIYDNGGSSTLRPYFTQLGGDIIIDGNAGGVAANSVPAGTALFYYDVLSYNSKAEKGNLIFVDPHAGTVPSTCQTVLWTDDAFASSDQHTTYFGDGISTDSGGHANGFYVAYPNEGSGGLSGYMSFGKVIVKGSPSGKNRNLSHTKPLTIQGDFKLLGAGAVYSMGSSLNVGGNIYADSGTIFNTTGIINFIKDGSVADVYTEVSKPQFLSGKGLFKNDSLSQFSGISVNNNNPSGVRFEIGDFTVKNAIFFNKGILNAGPTTNVTFLNPVSTHYATAGDGWLRAYSVKKRILVSTSSQTINFPLGDSTNYMPVTVIAPKVTGEGYIKLRIPDGDHPYIATSGINPSKSVNKYYKIDTIGGFVCPSLNLTLGWSDGLSDPGVFWYNSFASAYRNSSWTMYNAPLIPAYNSIQVSGLSNTNISGEYQLGTSGIPPVITQQPAPVTICAGALVSYSVTAAPATAYQWQENTGSGWSNLQNGVLYSGVNLATLYINGVTAGMNGYAYRCSIYNMYDSTVSGAAALQVNTSVVPTIDVTVNPGNSICSGIDVTFIAVLTNGGNTPTYEWRKNGVVVGSNNPQYADNTLASGDIIICNATSSSGCANPTLVSDTITMAVSPSLFPSIVVSVGPNDTICAGSTATFTATPTDAGANPSYQWSINGVNVSGTSSTFSSNAISHNDRVACVVTSNSVCSVPQSVGDTIQMAVLTTAAPYVNITVAAPYKDSICAGQIVSFNANGSGGGGPYTSSSYSWTKNGVAAGTGTSYSPSAALLNNDVIKCILTASNFCSSPSTYTDSVVMKVKPYLTPSILIIPNPNDTICLGTAVTFTASITDGGSNPAYEWSKNGSITGINSNTYTDNSIANNDIIKCKLTSNYQCLSSNNKLDSVKMTVNSNVVPVITIIVSPKDTICTGTSVTFTATSTFGGISPSYQWKRNSINVGANSNSFTTNTLSNNDTVWCIMTSNDLCIAQATDTSNIIVMTVTSSLTPGIVISSSPNNAICAGTLVTFTAVPANGGASPSYQWQINGSNAGANNNTFTSSSLNNGDIVTCVLTSSLNCITKTTDTSNSVIMTVAPVLTPDVTITANPGNTICTGTSVVFTATPVNGGTIPSYQWKVNGVNAGTNSIAYTGTGLATGDIVSCIMASNAVCLSKPTDTSNTIAMTVNPMLIPLVSIAANPGNTICSGTSVTFTATPVNGGTVPSYQWKVNGSNAGTNTNIYTSSSLSNADVVSCVLTSNATCAGPVAAASNNIVMTVNPVLIPSVSITANPGNTICAGTSVTFTATPVNGGTAPSYQWKLNGSSSGTNSSTYTSSILNNTDVVSCVVTSNATCASPATATSNNITMTVNPALTPSVSITANPGNTICAGTSVTFTTTPVNGGTSPSYQWKLNGSNTGTNSNTYTNGSLINTDVVSCVLTSNAGCITSATATSNSITMTVNPVLTPSVSIIANPGNTICAGTSVTFTATAINGGTSPSYQWKLNGGNVGTNSSTYTNSTLTASDVISCVMTSGYACPATITATSNIITMTVNATVTPAISINATPGNTICIGNAVTFTATIANGGSSPTYQWKVNGTNIGSNSNSYITNTLANGDIVTCALTSNAMCTTIPSVTSTSVTMTVNPVVTPSITVLAAPGGIICAGTSVTFTATAVNGGTLPAYQWKKNGINTGAGSQVYIDNTLANGDAILCVLAGNALCASLANVSSSPMNMTVNPVVIPAVTLTASPSTSGGPWRTLTFTATPVNGGASPAYQWRRNGQFITGANSNTYQAVTNKDITDGDTICVILKSNATCAMPDTAGDCAPAILIDLGVNSITDLTNLKLFPNPNSGSFILKGNSGTNNEIMVDVINTLGQTIYRSTIKPLK